MVTHVPTVLSSSTMGEARKALEAHAKDFDTMPYVYVVDGLGHLQGAVSLRDVFRAGASDRAIQYSPSMMHTVRPNTDQERVALLALKEELKAVPVVESSGVLLGVVRGDEILRVLHEEAAEDIGRFGGVWKGGMVDDIFHLPVRTSLKHRLPWLVLGLVGGLGAAGIVRGFEGVLSQNLILAAFIPLIVYMADAVGTQMEAFIIRDLAVHPTLMFRSYLLRQCSIVVLIGGIVSSLLFAMALGWHKDPLVALVLALALFCAILTSLVTGLVVPYVFSRLKLDPANASGPVATILQDLLSVTVYFSIASVLL